MKIGNIINGMTSGGALNESDVAAFKDMRAQIPGWSELLHMAFFKCVAAEMNCHATRAQPIGGVSALICGVYHGLDLAMAERFLFRDISIIGVDLFSSEPCADWPQEKRSMTWEQAFGCAPPDMEAAKINAPRSRIHRSKSVDYLKECGSMHDFVYLDTSHDEATVAAEIEALKWGDYNPDQIIAGDDWSVPDARFDCGVAKAVTDAFNDPIVIANRIWIARRSDMK